MLKECRRIGRLLSDTEVSPILEHAAYADAMVLYLLYGYFLAHNFRFLGYDVEIVELEIGKRLIALGGCHIETLFGLSELTYQLMGHRLLGKEQIKRFLRHVGLWPPGRRTAYYMNPEEYGPGRKVYQLERMVLLRECWQVIRNDPKIVGEWRKGEWTKMFEWEYGMEKNESRYAIPLTPDIARNAVDTRKNADGYEIEEE
jgi:hypothetical protein